MTDHFKKSADNTIGIELEWQLIDAASFELTSGAYKLLNDLACSGPAQLTPEITLSMIEFNSSIHHSIDTLANEINFIKKMVMTKATPLGIHLCGGGCHPFQDLQSQKITLEEPFLSDFNNYGYLAKQFTLFGQHIHIGCSSGDLAIYLCHAFSRYIPHFIALSACSPFYRGNDTCFDSVRMTLLNSFPFCGNLPWVENWKAYAEYTEIIMKTGMLKSFKDLFWDIRPQAKFGTIEIRACDSPLTLEKTLDLTAYAQMLALYLINQPIKVRPGLYFPYYFNRFQAAKKGLQANYVDPYKKTSLLLGQDILATCKELMPYAKKLQYAEVLKRMTQQVESGYNEASSLREGYAKSENLKEVVKEQISLWRRE